MPWTLPKIFSTLTVSSALLLPGVLPQAGFASEPPSPQRSSALQRLGQMFSPEIQSTIGACLERGKVDVAAGPTDSGAVRCGDGSTASVPYAAYVTTVSDLLTASSLVGFRTVLQSNAGVSPAMLRMFLNSPQGAIVLRQAVQSAITQSELLPATATESTNILTDAVLARLLPSLQDPTTLDTLLGTAEQYNQVVQEFCTAPGMSVDQAKLRLPLNELQLYAICIQESGVADEVLRLGGRYGWQFGRAIMTVVLTNDDGIDAPGLLALQRALDQKCVIVAPQQHHSGCSHQVTSDRPIAVERRSPHVFAVGGTPADCTRLALRHLCPDVKFVLSGVNAGGNLGADVYVSGTVAAVREAALHRVPGIAFSQYKRRGLEIDWEVSTRLVRLVLDRLLDARTLPGTFWNVNLPHLEPDAPDPTLVFCPLCTQPLPTDYRVEGDTFVYAGNYNQRQRDTGADVDVCFGGNIAITQLRLWDG